MIFLGDFNIELLEQLMKDFSPTYNCKNSIEDKTCYKNPENPKCTDLKMADMTKSFQNSWAIEAGLSDFHKMCFTVLKVFYTKQRPHIIQYRSYTKFSNKAFINDLQNTFFQFSCSCENCYFEKFKKKKKTVDVSLKKHAPLKKRYVRASQAPRINKTIKKS